MILIMPGNSLYDNKQRSCDETLLCVPWSVPSLFLETYSPGKQMGRGTLMPPSAKTPEQEGDLQAGIEQAKRAVVS